MTNAKPPPGQETLDYIRDHFHYDGDGNLFRKFVRKVKKTGSIGQCGYLNVKVLRVNYYAHILIWFLSRGVWPTHDIDHIDRDRINNRPQNLRPGSRSQNNANSGRRRRNPKSPYKGIALKRNAKWFAQCKKRVMGPFETPEEAARHYDAMAEEAHGEYACTNVDLGLLPPI